MMLLILGEQWLYEIMRVRFVYCLPQLAAIKPGGLGLQGRTCEQNVDRWKIPLAFVFTSRHGLCGNFGPRHDG